MDINLLNKFVDYIEEQAMQVSKQDYIQDKKIYIKKVSISKILFLKRET